MRSVHGAVVQLQQTPASKLGQQRGMQARPDTRLGPVPQPTPGRHTGAAHGFRRNVAPGDTGSQHVQHAGECHAIGNAQAPGVATSSFGSGRQQRGHALPQIVRNKISTHPDTLSTVTANGKTLSLTWPRKCLRGGGREPDQFSDGGTQAW